MRGWEWARPVALTWILLAGVSGALLVRAVLASPPGTVFVGTLYYVDDFYNYLSYVQQAEDGALVFGNKLASPDLPPALVNLEWLVVGWLSVLLGGAPLVAYRLLGLGALAGFVVVVDRWLVRGGLPPPRRLAALLLVFTGGGLGGLLVTTGWIGPLRPYDLAAGLYPFVETVANPHFVIGTTLLAAALGAFAGDRPLLGVTLGNVLALVRPYDAALLAAVQGVAILLRWPAREWPRRLLPLATKAITNRRFSASSTYGRPCLPDSLVNSTPAQQTRIHTCEHNAPAARSSSERTGHQPLVKGSAAYSAAVSGGATPSGRRATRDVRS